MDCITACRHTRSVCLGFATVHFPASVLNLGMSLGRQPTRRVLVGGGMIVLCWIQLRLGLQVLGNCRVREALREDSKQKHQLYPARSGRRTRII